MTWEASPEMCLGYDQSTENGDFPEEYTHCEFDRSVAKSLKDVHAMFLTNNERFETDIYAPDEPVVEESVLHFIPMPTQPHQYYFDIEQTNLKYDDNLVMSIAGITETVKDLFSVSLIGSSTTSRDFFTPLAVYF